MQRNWLLGVLALAVLTACSSDSDDEVSCGVAPVAADDVGEVRRGGIVTLDVLANDSNPGCGDLRITGTGDAAHGNVAIDEGRLVYMPSRNYIGADSFSYTIANDDGEASAVVTVDVYESLTLQGEVALHRGVEFADFDDAQITLSYGDALTDASVNDAGEYSLSIRVYDVEDPRWGRLDLALSATPTEGSSARRIDLHALLPPHADLLQRAELRAAGDGGEAYVVESEALPGLKVTSFSSAFYALAQADFMAFEADWDAETTNFAERLNQVALTIDAQRLHDIAQLNAGLIDGVLGEHDIRVPNEAVNFVGLVNDGPRMANVLAQLQALDTQPELSADVFAAVDTEALRGRHLEIGAQLPQWLRAYDYTWHFGVNELARSKAGTDPQFATYVTDNEALHFSNLLSSARLLYAHGSADGGSMWFSAQDRDDNPVTFRLMKDAAFAPSGEVFDMSRDWVMPSTAGRAMETLYRFVDDGTFTTAHGQWADDLALRSGEWSLTDGGATLLLTQGDKQVQVRKLAADSGLPLVLLEDMQNQALRVGPALRLDAEVSVVNEFRGKRLLSLFELRGPEHWRQGELQTTPHVDVTFLSQTQGSLTRQNFTLGFEWQEVSHSGIAQAIEMRGQTNLGTEQRYYWLPLRKEEGRLLVLEWAQVYSERGSVQSLLTPRINVYCERDACQL